MSRERETAAAIQNRFTRGHTFPTASSRSKSCRITCRHFVAKAHAAIVTIACSACSASKFDGFASDSRRFQSTAEPLCSS
eukprot:1194425-Prorocentrum_minimum.AAC.4